MPGVIRQGVSDAKLNVLGGRLQEARGIYLREEVY